MYGSLAFVHSIRPNTFKMFINLCKCVTLIGLTGVFDILLTNWKATNMESKVEQNKKRDFPMILIKLLFSYTLGIYCMSVLTGQTIVCIRLKLKIKRKKKSKIKGFFFCCCLMFDYTMHIYGLRIW